MDIKKVLMPNALTSLQLAYINLFKYVKKKLSILRKYYFKAK